MTNETLSMPPLGDDDEDDELPPSFTSALHPNYLGNPRVIEQLIATRAKEIFEGLTARGNGTMTSPDYVAFSQARGRELSHILTGQHPDYPGIAGWNSPDVGLVNRLKVNLSTYWQQERSKYNDDPVQVLNAYLSWAIFDIMQNFNDDDGTIFELKMGELLRKICGMLLDTNRKA